MNGEEKNKTYIIICEKYTSSYQFK